MKKITAIFLLVLISAAVDAQIPTNGLIGGWPFSGNANDVSGSNNHGTVSNCTLTTDRFGQQNSAYAFNGSSSYIVMTNAGPTGTVSRSVSFWAKTNSSSGPVVGFNYGDINVFGGIYQIVFNYNCQGVGFDNGSATYMRSGSGINNNQWHHIVAVLNATNSTQIGGIDFYVDGSLQTSISCGGGNSPINSTNATPICIGKSCNSSLRYWNGLLDDFYMYNRALSSTEVLALYNYTPCTAAPSAPTSVLGNTLTCLSSGAATFTAQTVSGASSYTWTLPSGWPTGSTQAIVTPTSPFTGTIGVAALNGCGQSAYTTISVNINQVVPLTLTASNTSLCPGGSALLSASGANSYTWSTGSNSSAITVSPSASTTYYVTGANSAGCTSQQMVTVSLLNGALPVISVSSSGASCAGEAVSLASNGASTYTWQPGNMTGFLVTAYPQVSTVYTVSGTGSNGCVGIATFAQSVLAAPVVQITAPAACSGQSVVLSAFGANSYTWMPGYHTGASITSTAVPGLSYTVVGTDGSGCNSQPAIVSVPVSPSPTVTAASGQPEICKGQNVTLAASGAQSFTWQPGNLTGFLVTVSPFVNTTYTVTGKDANGCTSTTQILQTVVICNALSEKNSAAPYVYPNPFVDVLYIELNGQAYSVTIQNMLGTVVFSAENLSQEKLELESLPAGTYFLRLNTNGGMQTQRIVKLAD